MDLVTISLALSLHIGFEGDYNSFHPHIRYNNDNFIAGVYYNSERTASSYLGYRFENNNLGLEVGAVTGYSHETVIPYVRGTYKDFFVTPVPVGPDTGIVFGYEVKF